MITFISLGIITVVFLFLASSMGIFARRNKFPVRGRTVLVTGGSQGMGKSVACKLAQRGANIAIVARDLSRLQKAIEEIEAAAAHPETQRFVAISADLSRAEEHARLFSDVSAWNSGEPPDIVFAVAGSSSPMLFANASQDILRTQMDVNFFSAAYLAHETIRAWIKPDTNPPNAGEPDPLPRHLIMTSSNVAFAGVAGYAPYGPSKSAIRSLSDCLRSEMNLYNGARHAKNSAVPAPPAEILIHAVFPGTISSPGLENENVTKHAITHMLEEVDPVQTADETAEISIRGLERGEYLIVTHLLGMAMRSAAWMGSPMNRWVIDIPLQWLSNLIWLFVGPDMDRQVWNYGKKYGMDGASGTGYQSKTKP